MCEWACSAYGWRVDYALHEVPAATIALLMRQHRVAVGTDDLMPLSIEEEIRNGG